jgi:hypothetical protein
MLGLVRQHIPADRAAGVVRPEGASEPAWLAANADDQPSGGAS